MSRKKHTRRSGRPIALAAATGAGLVALSLAAAQDPARSQTSPPAPEAYNPYPPGILPPDLTAEIERVRGEVRQAFDRALKEWRDLGPLTREGNPPAIAGPHPATRVDPLLPVSLATRSRRPRCTPSAESS